ncbi:MAG: zinc finger domain-containing protein, partial [Fuerstiella sp.]
NLYASEILHRARISPLRPASQLTFSQIERLAEATDLILNEAIKYEGSTLSDGTYRNALNKDGGYQNEHRVYQKSDTRCSNCDRGTIKRIVQAQRSTFYCPVCQRR